MAKIVGYTPEEVASSEREILQTLANNLDSERAELIKRKAKLEEDNENHQQKRIDYRITSAKRVISFIAYNVKSLEPMTIHTLLVHCLNKLNGNLDGVEVILERDKESEDKNEKATND